MSDFGFLSKTPRKIEFLAEEELLMPQDIFNLFYSGLDHLIHQNIELESNEDYKKIKRCNPDSEYLKKLDKEKQLEILKWSNSLKKNIVAKMTFDDTSEVMFTAIPRVNFKRNHLFKRPSVVHFVDNVGRHFVLREARNYDVDKILKKMGYWSYGNRFDYGASSQFTKNVIEGFAKPPNKKNGVMIIPEPQLLSALENLYNATGLPRITPDLRVIDADKNNLYYIRDFLPLAIDTVIEKEKMMRYIGTLHCLGLMELLDRQLVHYAVGKQGILNYDPDFISYDGSNGIQKDIHDFKNVVKSDSVTDKTIYLNEQDVSDILGGANLFKNVLSKENDISTSTIFSELYTTIDKNRFPDDKLMELVGPNELNEES